MDGTEAEAVDGTEAVDEEPGEAETGTDAVPGTGTEAEAAAVAAPAVDEAPDNGADEAQGSPGEVTDADTGVSGPELHMAVVASVAVDLPAAHPVVVVRELEPPGRQLSFPVAPADGAALAHALRRVPTARPLTHDLFVDVLTSFDIDLVAVRLVGRQGGTYFAEVDLQGPRQRTVLSCRPSDALGLALRASVPVPILVDVRLFEGGGDLLPGT
ncbi:MAG: bifunctional nuclease family protein [Actinomycetota bacterium]|nr:bifunctional nuclease family protein [Actinomycetota bacterium]